MAERTVWMVLAELRAAYGEASGANWDGHGAGPASPEAYELAQRVIESLDPSLLPESVGVDPDGEFSFDWGGGHVTVSVGIGPDGRLSYAGLFGSSRVGATYCFQGRVPQTILAGIRRVRLEEE